MLPFMDKIHIYQTDRADTVSDGGSSGVVMVHGSRVGAEQSDLDVPDSAQFSAGGDRDLEVAR